MKGLCNQLLCSVEVRYVVKVVGYEVQQSSSKFMRLKGVAYEVWWGGVLDFILESNKV